jgi:hypothetical protein
MIARATSWFSLIALFLTGCAAATRGMYVDDREVVEPSIGNIYSASHAVVIGIDRYQKMSQLDGAVRDAEYMAGLLKARGFEVTLLRDQEATRGRLASVLGDELPRRLRKNDRVVVYFAGHGVNPKHGQRPLGYLMPVEGDHAAPAATGVSMREMQSWFHDHYRARHVLFIADACYSGLAIEHRTRGAIVPDTEGYLELITREPARISLVAGTKGQRSHEFRGHGVFTYFIGKGLEGAADANDDGLVTSSELFSYVQPAVAREVRRLGGEQLPQHGRSGEGEFIFFSTLGGRRPSTTPRALEPQRQPRVDVQLSQEASSPESMSKAQLLFDEAMRRIDQLLDGLDEADILIAFSRLQRADVQVETAEAQLEVIASASGSGSAPPSPRHRVEEARRARLGDVELCMASASAEVPAAIVLEKTRRALAPMGFRRAQIAKRWESCPETSLSVVFDGSVTTRASNSKVVATGAVVLEVSGEVTFSMGGRWLGGTTLVFGRGMHRQVIRARGEAFESLSDNLALRIVEALSLEDEGSGTKSR